MESHWSKLEKLIDHYPASRVVIGEVNCDREIDLCAREDPFSTFVFESEGQAQQFPMLKLYVRRDDAMMKMLLMKNLLLQLHGLEDEEEEEAEEAAEEPTMYTYNEKSIDLLSLELFLRRKLPREVIEGPSGKTAASLLETPKDGEESNESSRGSIPMTSIQKKMAARVRAFNSAHNFLELNDDNFAPYLSHGKQRQQQLFLFL